MEADWCLEIKTQDKWESGTDDTVQIVFSFSDQSECITSELLDPSINNFCAPPACRGGLVHTYCDRKADYRFFTGECNRYVTMCI